MKLIELFDIAIEKKASDIHLTTGQAPRFRIDGRLERTGDLAPGREALREILEPFLEHRDRGRLEEGLPVEGIMERGGIAFVGLAFRHGEGELTTTFRLLSGGIPSLEKVGGSEQSVFEEALKSSRGLILVTGPSMSGKWTTGCSMIEEINRTQASRIFVVESHPNYRWEGKESMVTPIHVGQDCDSYEQALSNVFQSDLDVIGLDDIPSASVLREVLSLAETGHLVIANLHADSVTDALRRLCCGLGLDGPEIRQRLAKGFVLITSQRLFRKVGSGRTAAYEYLLPSTGAREAVARGELDEIDRLISDGVEAQSLRRSVERLVEAGTIIDEKSSALVPD